MFGLNCDNIMAQFLGNKINIQRNTLWPHALCLLCNNNVGAWYVTVSNALICGQVKIYILIAIIHSITHTLMIVPVRGNLCKGV